MGPYRPASRPVDRRPWEIGLDPSSPFDARGNQSQPVPETDVELGHFTDPEGHLIGLVRETS